MKMHLPRVLIAAPMSGSGKTTVTAGLIAALRARLMQVAPFKVGPDYIDPAFHALAAARTCHNLDGWMLESDQVRDLFVRQSQGADITVIEGVMGLFDGAAGDDDHGSAAHIARITDTPVILVLDARAMARTAAALVLGLCTYDPAVRIAGVILNQVGSERHAALITDAIQQRLAVPVVGHLPRSDALRIPERHLGLVPTAEAGRWTEWLELARHQIEATVDIDQIIAIAKSAPPIEALRRRGESEALVHAIDIHHFGTQAGPTIAVARDEAFSFHYADNLDLLCEAGAKLAFFSPLHDQALPPATSALYLCGGFPELYAGALSQNDAMRCAIQQAGLANIPIYAECGGLMYLTEGIVDQQGITHPMVGLLPEMTNMTNRLTMGYRTIRAECESWLWSAGEEARGHEFHYSTWQRPATLPPAYALLPRGFQSETRFDGACTGNIFASYVHLYFRATPGLAERFVARAALHAQK